MELNAQNRYLLGNDLEGGPMAPLLEAGEIRGGATHDARIAACCLRHGVSELRTADRDFSRYPALRVRNPLVAVNERRPKYRARLAARRSSPA